MTQAQLRISDFMSTSEFRITVDTGIEQLTDVLGHADRLLTEMCEQDDLDPIAVITAALMLLKEPKR